jgi:hypothetical protein
MKIRNASSKSLAFVIVVLLCGSVFSCNRGYGCPTNFSLDDVFNVAVQVVVSIFS